MHILVPFSFCALNLAPARALAAAQIRLRISRARSAAEIRARFARPLGAGRPHASLSHSGPSIVASGQQIRFDVTVRA
jgi:hypothetical protein